MSDNLRMNYTSNQSQISLIDIDEYDFENLLEKCKSVKVEMDNVYDEKVIKTYEELFNYELNTDSEKKNEEKNDKNIVNEEEELEQRTYKSVYYGEPMDIEEAMWEDIKNKS